MGVPEVAAAKAAYAAYLETERRWRTSILLVLYVQRETQKTALDAALAALSGPELAALQEGMN